MLLNIWYGVACHAPTHHTPQITHPHMTSHICFNCQIAYYELCWELRPQICVAVVMYGHIRQCNQQLDTCVTSQQWPACLLAASKVIVLAPFVTGPVYVPDTSCQYVNH